ncbi:hypothetical protein [Henriciella litoralis]|uniref:hypothetical protein n=1 Tax=Henriciella litoralis TaxID=568102 RepID=UPI000A066F1B|nr:hypothetical protein [Henriciella litoralis]
MILQRLATSFRKQDWFTVVVETLIVVFGVFIGLQMNNWNERLNAASREANLISQLHAAFVVELENVKDGHAYTVSLRDATSHVLEVLDGDEPPADTEAFAEELLFALQSIGPVFEVPIVSVIMSTGDLAELSSPTLRNALTDYHFQIDGVRTLSVNQMRMLADLSNGAQRGLRIVIDDETGLYRIAEYDFEALKSARELYQAQLTTQIHLLEYIGDVERTTETIVEELERQRR